MPPSQSDAARASLSIAVAAREQPVPAIIPDQQARYQLKFPAKSQSLQFINATTIKSVGVEKRKHLRQYLVKNARQNKIHASSIQPSQKIRLLVWRHREAPSKIPHLTTTNAQSLVAGVSALEANSSQVPSHGYQTPQPTEATSQPLPPEVELTQKEMHDMMFYTLPPGAQNPRTFLGAGRVDPFVSYSIDLEPFEHQILDFRKILAFPLAGH